MKSIGMLSFNMLTIPVGLVILVFGRKLFWLFVGGVGFISGMHIAAGILQGQPGWMVLFIALGVGFIGAMAAVFLQRFAVVASGFLAGGYLAANLMTLWVWQIGPLLWLVIFLFGIVGAAAAYLFFDWALIFFSALTGAAVITENLTLSAALSTLLMAVLCIIGVTVLVALMQRGRARSSARKTLNA